MTGMAGNCSKGNFEIDYNEYFLIAVEEFLGLGWIEPPPTERQAEIDQIKLLVRRAANKIISEESLIKYKFFEILETKALSSPPVSSLLS